MPRCAAGEARGDSKFARGLGPGRVWLGKRNEI
jgi:hypothetical protein